MGKKTIQNTLLTVRTDRIFGRMISINLPRVQIPADRIFRRIISINLPRVHIPAPGLLSRFKGLRETETTSVERNGVIRLN
jgi:hypothetical protein